VETVTALLIIVVVLRISAAILFQTVAAGVPLERLKASAVLCRVLQEIKTRDDLSQVEKQVDGYAVHTEIIRVYTAGSAEVRVSVYDSSGRLLAARRHVVLLNP